MNIDLKGLSLIGARRGSGGDGEGKALNPATGETLDPAYLFESTEAVAEAARLAAEAAPVFQKTSGADRAAFLRAIASGLEANVDQIAERMGLESALPEPRCRGEHARTCGQLRMFANLVEEGSWVDARIEHADPERAPLPKPDTRSMLRAVGPVAVFGASNFPLAFSVAGGDTASAFAAGCPVVVKAHPAHPGTSELVGAVIREAVESCGLPEGVFSLIFGRGIELGQALVQQPEIRAVGFTGSRQAGRALMDLAAARPEPIPVFAEMSSINPMFLLPGAMKAGSKALAEGFVASLTLGVGQFCTNPGLVFMAAEDVETFAADLEESITASQPGTMLTAGISEHYACGVSALENAEGVAVMGRSATEAAVGQASPVVFTTTVEEFLKNPALSDEVFGPASLVVSC
ncbi:MAG: aldehyde dehydrogenase (NADP(+)), partial [Verrucomicrobiales bacterium]